MHLLSHFSNNKQNLIGKKCPTCSWSVSAGFLQVSSVQGVVLISAAPCSLLLCNFIELSLPSFQHLLSLDLISGSLLLPEIYHVLHEQMPSSTRHNHHMGYHQTSQQSVFCCCCFYLTRALSRLILTLPYCTLLWSTHNLHYFLF